MASVAVLVAAPATSALAQTAPGQSQNTPLPRFASLKSDRVNMRSGPSVDTPILWVYRRAGLPVEVLKEGADGWRQVRDAEGATGWVVQTMLSNRRTAVILPWEIKPGVASGWCKVTVGDAKGYVEQKKLWGVYPDETIK
jgi:SH3-like domain-containing protein